MADIFTKAKRSDVMSRVRSTGNRATELRLIAVFRAHGITGWRRKAAVFGKPDFVFSKLRLAVFVDGCFWHGCPLHATQPKTNAVFWRTKIARNQVRDRLVTRTLRAEGWRVLRIWEHELRTGRTKNLRRETGNLKGGGRRAAPARLLARLRRAGLTLRGKEND